MKQIITRQARRWLAGVGRRLGRSPNESGQSIIILTFAFLGMVAMLGLALDLGMVYVERIRLKRTVDAAALAGVSELPNEEAAALRAIDYLRQNGYNVDDSHVYVAGCVQDVKGRVNPSGTTDLVNFPRSTMFDFATLPVTATLPISPALFYYYDDTAADSAPAWYIDTHSFSRSDPNSCEEGVSVKTATAFGGSSRIRVYGEVPVPMSFMQFFGFPAVTVSDEAVAQNSSSLDVAVVFDVTSSMELDTICYDCWRRCDQLPAGMICGTDYNKYSAYPKNGKALNYDFYSDRMAVLRQNQAIPKRLNTPGAGGDGKKPYIIIEAEFYTNNTSIWDPAARTAGVGYWALQRTLGGEGYSIDGYGYLGTTDNRSGFVRHHPYVAAEGNMGDLPFGRHYTLGDARGETAFKAPRLDYYFWPVWDSSGDTTYIYLRTQAFAKGDYGTTAPFDEFFWSVDNGQAQQALSLGGVTNKDDNRISNDWRMGRDERKWHWVRLNAGVLSPDRHTLHIWAGSTGFAIDRIVVTAQSTLNDEIKQEAATPGSAQGMARDMCNPIFGLEVTQASCNTHQFPAEPEQAFIQLPAFSVNNLNDPLFGDYQPYRGSSEAVKAFIARLDPTLDQAGLVTFVARGTQRAQLECLVAARIRKDQGAQVDNYPADVPGVEYDETACFENAVSGTVPISYNNVFIQLEQIRDVDLQGGTNIASGLRRGLNMLALDTDDNTATRTHQNDCKWTRSGGWKIDNQTQPDEDVDSHCARGQAATPIIVLMTDGSPTKDEALDGACTTWSDSHPLPYEGFEPRKNDAKYECIMYYADLAQQYGVIVYIIGLGNGVDHDLLRATAEMTFGQYYYAPSPAALNFIFDQILTNVYISLVQ